MEVEVEETPSDVLAALFSEETDVEQRKAKLRKEIDRIQSFLDYAAAEGMEGLDKHVSKQKAVEQELRDLEHGSKTATTPQTSLSDEFDTKKAVAEKSKKRLSNAKNEVE